MPSIITVGGIFIPKKPGGECMKDYVIWLKSGECISGSVQEEIISHLQERFKDCMNSEKVSFSDEDGIVIIDLYSIDAIAINKQPSSYKLGF